MPGPTADKPNVYQFGYPYEAMYQELKAKDQKLCVTHLRTNRNSFINNWFGLGTLRMACYK